jgi:hypothetical protein
LSQEEMKEEEELPKFDNDNLDEFVDELLD